MALIPHKNWLKITQICKIMQSMKRNEVGYDQKRWYNNEKKLIREKWRRLRPMIKKRIENRAKDYPIQAMIPVANQVLIARSELFYGVSALLKAFPVFSCKFCPEVYVGETGHLIQSCLGYKRDRIQLHQWITASLDDILVPVQTFHLDRWAQDEIVHNQRFDIERVSAVVELCQQAGALLEDSNLQSPNAVSSLSTDELKVTGTRTLKAWETLREGLEKLLLVYPVKVCKYCSEVHVGPSGHRARLCGVFKFQRYRGKHFWEKATVDDIVPPKIGWYRRPRDPPVLLNEGRKRYGHAPAVVDLCCKAGAIPPEKYLHMMKVKGLVKSPFDNFSF